MSKKVVDIAATTQLIYIPVAYRTFNG